MRPPVSTLDVGPTSKTKHAHDRSSRQPKNDRMQQRRIHAAIPNLHAIGSVQSSAFGRGGRFGRALKTGKKIDEIIKMPAVNIDQNCEITRAGGGPSVRFVTAPKNGDQLLSDA